MDPRNIFPGATYLVQTRCINNGCGMASLEECRRLLGFMLGWTGQRCALRGDPVEVCAAVQVLDGWDFIVRNVYDGLSWHQQEANRIIAYNRNAGLGRTGHEFFKSRRFRAWRLHTPEDIWSAMIEMIAYPVAAGLVRRIDHYEGLVLTPEDLGSHSFDLPRGFVSLATPEPPERTDLTIEMAPVGIKAAAEYKAEFKRRLDAYLEQFDDDRKPLGKKRINRLTLRDPAPRPLLPDNSPRARPQPAWANHIDESVDPDVTEKLKNERQEFLEEYSDAYGDIETHGWEGFGIAEFPPGTYGWRRKLRCSVRGSPGPGIPAPRSVIDGGAAL